MSQCYFHILFSNCTTICIYILYRTFRLILFHDAFFALIHNWLLHGIINANNIIKLTLFINVCYRSYKYTDRSTYQKDICCHLYSTARTQKTKHIYMHISLKTVINSGTSVLILTQDDPHDPTCHIRETFLDAMWL